MNELATKFNQLFAGSDRGHGTCELSDDGKIKATTVHAPANETVWAYHLDGTRNLGIVPLRPNGTCVFGAIDVEANDEVDVLIQQLKSGTLPLIPCKTKSGGAHLYFFSEPIPAIEMQGKMKQYAALIGLPKAEVYPKQTVVSNEVGSWLLMPYFNARYTKRYAIDATGKRMSAEQFLQRAIDMIGVPL